MQEHVRELYRRGRLWLDSRTLAQEKAIDPPAQSLAEAIREFGRINAEQRRPSTWPEAFRVVVGLLGEAVTDVHDIRGIRIASGPALVTENLEDGAVKVTVSFVIEPDADLQDNPSQS